MSLPTSTFGASNHTIENAYDDAVERVNEVSEVKSELGFVGIFANLIRKMDETAQAAV